MNQGDLGDLGNLDTATLLQHLPRVRFPAEKDQVAATAEKNDAPPGAGAEDQERRHPTLQWPRRGLTGGARTLEQ
jgi:hypothetical protein